MPGDVITEHRHCQDCGKLLRYELETESDALKCWDCEGGQKYVEGSTIHINRPADWHYYFLAIKGWVVRSSPNYDPELLMTRNRGELQEHFFERSYDKYGFIGPQWLWEQHMEKEMDRIGEPS